MAAATSSLVHAAVVVLCLLAGSDPPPRLVSSRELGFFPIDLIEPVPTPSLGTPAQAEQHPGLPSPRPRPRVRRVRVAARRVTATAAPVASSMLVPELEGDELLEESTRDEVDGDDNGPSTPAENGGASGSAAAPMPQPRRISPLEAAYLRTYQTFPSLPRSLWAHGRLYTVVVQLCVSAEGRVTEVTLQQGAAPELDALVLAALRTWRYRAPIVDGKPVAFCHPMKLHYDVD